MVVTAVTPNVHQSYTLLSSSDLLSSSKGMSIYKPHTAYGMVGTSAAAYLGRRNRL